MLREMRGAGDKVHFVWAQRVHLWESVAMRGLIAACHDDIVQEDAHPRMPASTVSNVR